MKAARVHTLLATLDVPSLLAASRPAASSDGQSFARLLIANQAASPTPQRTLEQSAVSVSSNPLPTALVNENAQPAETEATPQPDLITLKASAAKDTSTGRAAHPQAKVSAQKSVAVAHAKAEQTLPTLQTAPGVNVASVVPVAVPALGVASAQPASSPAEQPTSVAATVTPASTAPLAAAAITPFPKGAVEPSPSPPAPSASVGLASPAPDNKVPDIPALSSNPAPLRIVPAAQPALLTTMFPPAQVVPVPAASPASDAPASTATLSVPHSDNTAVLADDLRAEPVTPQVQGTARVESDHVPRADETSLSSQTANSSRTDPSDQAVAADESQAPRAEPSPMGKTELAPTSPGQAGTQPPSPPPAAAAVVPRSLHAAMFSAPSAVQGKTTREQPVKPVGAVQPPHAAHAGAILAQGDNVEAAQPAATQPAVPVVVPPASSEHASHVPHSPSRVPAEPSPVAAETQSQQTQATAVYAPEPRVLAASAQALEVGVSSGTHGWLRVRAELGHGGEVTALVTANAGAAESVHRALPALNEYLAREAVPVSSVEVRTASPSLDAYAASALDAGGSGQTARGDDRDRAALAFAAQSQPGTAATATEVSVAPSTLAAWTEGSGGWVNVRV